MADSTARSAHATPGGKAWYSLFIFYLVYTMINVDRSILAVMIEPIKIEFHLTDTQIGFLTGIAFALFFGIAGIPLGRWSDRGSRKIVLSWSLFVFSLMTAAAGFVTNFVQLLITRLIVGAGEAGGGPASLSMVSDQFPVERRASAISLYYLGSPTGQILIFLFGGILVANYGWRSAFWAAGGLGLLLALVIALTIREPERKADGGGVVADAPSFKAVLAFMRKQPSLLHILGTGMITSAVSSGVGVWSVSFLMRSHGMEVQYAGAAVALAHGGAAFIGIASSGWIVDWLGRRDVRWRSWFCVLTQAAGLPAFLLYVLAPTPVFAVAGLALWSAAQSAIYAPVAALCQSLVGSRMRGSVMAVFYFLSNFVGFGLGPQLVGIGSDLGEPRFGADSLRYALLGFAFFFVWASYHYFRAGVTLKEDFVRTAEAS